ncbi:RNA-binding protein [Trypanosoma grayi]|uniref:RNA-binding protein n=1 Tax=Trypanosoma grayi TaxID=71804 RepID=UPI0004F41CFF|nr:RNA-binding protein [Trypanosoma grayi]KEG11816.1 RNA-binding protein [Trypanosoma grayi]
MAAWADDIDPIALDEEFGDKAMFPLEEQADKLALKDAKEAWDNAKMVVETVTDSENKRYEIVKKVRTYHVDRPATVVDIRAKWKRFGKDAGNMQDLVSRDPPIVLELGDVDPLERVARDEVVRLMNEAERMKIEVTDPRLQRFAKIKEEQRKAALEEAAPSDQAKERTWAAARGEKSSAQRKEDTDRRLRITNISDDISKEELYNIFDTDEYHIEKLFLPKDSVTGNYRGFAFITFEDADQADRCLRKTKGTARFKNTVMRIARALPEGDQRRH